MPEFELNSWQCEDAAQIIAWGGGIIGHSMGVGKTAIAIEVIKRTKAKKVLLVVPVIAVGVWQSELKKWSAGLRVDIVQGTKLKRNQWYVRNFAEAEIIIVTYDVAVRDRDELKKRFKGLVICDEAHRLKNRKTLRFKAIKSIVTAGKDKTSAILMTGTPARTGSQDLWTLLHLVDKKTFRSYWKFVDTYCEMFDNGYGNEIIGTRNSKQLRELLERRYMVRRTKEQVFATLPPKIQQIVSISMQPRQARMYKELAEEAMLSLQEGGWLLASSQLSLLTRLRQLVVCPKLIDPGINEYGEGLETIWEIWQNADVNSGVIFTPFPSVSPYVEKFLQEKGEDRFILLRGGMGPDEVMAAVDKFNVQGGFLLASIKFAESYDLSICSLCWFLGCEWVPAENAQAEDRLHRRTSKNVVNSYFLKHNHTIEGSINMTLHNKALNLKYVFHDYDSCLRALGLENK